MKKHVIGLVVLGFALSGCSIIAPEAYNRPVEPENLLDRSTERVNLALSSKESLDTLTDWVDRKVPKKAEVSCNNSSKLCAKARKILKSYGIEIIESSSSDSDIALVYEKVTAYDCDPRYVDMPINPYNLSPPHFGCAYSSNIVKMVSDRRQFYSPAMTGDTDAERSVKAYDFYRNRPQKDVQLDQLVNSSSK